MHNGKNVNEEDQEYYKMVTRIVGLDFYLDGGTAKIDVSGRTYYLDRRLGEDEMGLYDKYPDEDSAKAVSRLEMVRLTSDLYLLLEDEEAQNNLFHYRESSVRSIIRDMESILNEREIREVETITHRRRVIGERLNGQVYRLNNSDPSS